MKKSINGFLIAIACNVFLITSFLLGQNETRVEHKLVAVKVYSNRAMLSAKAETNVNAGTYLFVFSGLPYTLDKNSITASAEQTGGVAGVIQSVSFRINYLNRNGKPVRMQQLEDSIRIINVLLEELADRSFVFEQEQNMILKNDQTAGKDKGVTAEELAKLSAFYRTRLLEIKNELSVIKRKMQYLTVRKSLNEQELNQVRVSRDKPTFEVVVSYKANSAGKLNLMLKYLVTNAGWVPKYDLRVDKIGKPLDMNLMADVSNATGEDWNNIAVTLSSAHPEQGGVPPMLNPQFVELYRPRPAAMMSRMGAAAPSVSMKSSAADASGEDLAAEENEKKEDKVSAGSAADYTQEINTALNVEYAISLPYNIPSDGKPRQVDIRQISLPTDYTLFAVPKMEKDAFLRASISGWEDYNLLPGNANVYFEGSFLTTTYLDPSSTKDTLQVGLGRDSRILIKRERNKDFTAKRFIGGKMTASFGYSIEVRNNKKEPILLILEDQYPVSRQNEIEVKLLNAEGARNEAAYGKLTWRLQLQPGETKKVGFSYEVKYPKDQTVIGL